MKFLSIIIFCTCSFFVNASSVPTSKSWVLSATGGYTFFTQIQSQNSTPLGRLAFEKIFSEYTKEEYILLNHLKKTSLGIEIGVQSGNRMQLPLSSSEIETLGGVEPWTTLYPFVDILGVGRVDFENFPLQGIFKAGPVFREWNMERNSINNLSQVAGEIQAGLGFYLTSNISIMLLYQGIYGGNLNIAVNSTTQTATVSSIPIQNGILLTASYYI
jgi:hypothetical protein